MTFIKSFRASSLQQAIELVRQELGPDATILDTKPIKPSLRGWFAKERIEVTASSTLPNSSERVLTDREVAISPQLTAASGIPISNKTRNETVPRIVSQEVKTASFEPFNAAASPNGSDPNRNEPSPKTMSAETNSSPTVAVQAKIDRQPSAFSGSVQSRTTRTIRNESKVRATHNPDLAVRHPHGSWESVYESLLAEGVQESLAADWLEAIYDDSLAEESIETIRHLLVQYVVSRLPVCKPITRVNATPVMIAIVGPTGSGKTTCLAKLASLMSQQDNATVGILSLDAFRVGAVDQLNHYASVMNLPLAVAAENDQIEASLQSLRDCSVILIDTPGFNPSDSESVGRIADAINLIQPTEIHLTLSANYSVHSFDGYLQGFQRVRPTHLMLTHLDDAFAIGNLLPSLTRLQSTDMRLGYVSVGQHVPRDFRSARPAQVALAMIGH